MLQFHLEPIALGLGFWSGCKNIKFKPFVFGVDTHLPANTMQDGQMWPNNDMFAVSHLSPYTFKLNMSHLAKTHIQESPKDIQIQSEYIYI